MTVEALLRPVHTQFVTTSPEEAHAYLQEAYAGSTMRIRGDRENFLMRYSQVDAGRLSVASMTHHPLAVDHDCEPLRALIVARVLDGSARRESGGESVRFGRGDIFLLARPDEPLSMGWETLRLQMTRIDLRTLSEVAADHGPVPDELRFTGLSPVSPVQARHWRTTVDYAMASLLARRDDLVSPLVIGSAARLLAAATLAAFANDGTPSDVPTPEKTTPAGLRRIISVMEERAHEDLSLFDVADAARVTPAALRQAFQHHLSTTPTAHLRQIRLDRAHEDLLYADPADGVTIEGVAARWGFGSRRRFDAAYRNAYGRGPEDTLAF